LRGRVVCLSVFRVRRVASQLFVLRFLLVFIHAAAGIYGIDLPTPRPASEAFVWMFARIVFRISSDVGGSGWTMAVVEAASRAGDCGSGDRPLLLFVQRLVLLVEGGADVWATVCGRLHSLT